MRGDWPVHIARSEDGLDIAVTRRAGAPPPFLVVSPLGTPARFSANLVPGIAAYCDCFLGANACFEFEWRGTGLSSSSSASLTIDQLALDILAAAREIGQPYYLLAFGAACVPAAVAAARDPSRVLGIFFESPTARLQLPSFGGDDADLGRRLTAHLRANYDFPPGIAVADLLSAYRRDVPIDQIALWNAALGSVDLPGVLRRVQPPVFIYTDPDLVASATSIAEHLPEAAIVVGTAHAYNAVRAAAAREAFDAYIAPGTPLAGPIPTGLGNTRLSSREREVVRQLAAGKSNAEIAATLGITRATVATHVRHVLEKTDSANRAEAASFAVRHGLA